MAKDNVTHHFKYHFDDEAIFGACDAIFGLFTSKDVQMAAIVGGFNTGDYYQLW